jgi:hypothetical protein
MTRPVLNPGRRGGNNLVISDHVDLMTSEDGQLIETCKDNKYLQIESQCTVLTIIL